jgi:hypothetical protein
MRHRHITVNFFSVFLGPFLGPIIVGGRRRVGAQTASSDGQTDSPYFFHDDIHIAQFTFYWSKSTDHRRSRTAETWPRRALAAYHQPCGLKETHG